MTKASVPEPKWLTTEVKKVFKHEIYGISNGLRLTKLIQKPKKP